MSTIAFTAFKPARVLLQAVAKATSKSTTTGAAAKAAATKKKKLTTTTTTGRSKSTPSAASKQELKPPAASGKRVSGLLKLYPISPSLSSFLGVSETCRPHAVKEIWAYVKLHNLQNQENRREIVCDEKLKTLFGGKDKVGFSDISKMISQHTVKAA